MYTSKHIHSNYGIHSLWVTHDIVCIVCSINVQENTNIDATAGIPPPLILHHPFTHKLTYLLHLTHRINQYILNTSSIESSSNFQFYRQQSPPKFPNIFRIEIIMYMCIN